VNLALTGNNLNVCGNWAAGTGANAVTVGSGNVVLQGTAAQTISGNTNFERLTVNATRSYTNNGTVTISQRYTPQAGSLNNAGTMTFLSTSPSDIATIDLNPANTGSLTGNITAQRFIPIGGSNQHYVSSPLNSLPLSQFGASGGSGNVVPTANCDETQLAVGSLYGTVFRYNEANGSACSLAGWEVVSSGSAENARGYSAYLTGAGTPLSVNGVANMGSTYTKTGNTNSNWTNTTLQGRSQNSGWALVGNPYLSTINLSDKTGAGFDNQAQVWQTSGPYTGTYQPVVMGSGSAFVAPFQGFMVRKTAVGGTADFTVGRSECVNNTSTFYKTSSNGTVSIVVHGNGFADVTKVVFDENSTNQFDNTMDANKLPGRLAQPMLASKLGSDLYSINNLNSIATNPTVPLEFMPGTNGSYTFTFDDISTFDPTVMVYLEDKMSQNGWYDLRARNVQTFACSTTDRKDRFVLHFTAPVQSDSKDADCDDLGTIALEEITTNNWNVTISNTQGAIVHTQVLDKNNPVNVKNLVPGTYDITFTTKSGYVATRQITISGVQPLVANISASTLTPNVNQSVQFNSSLNTAATVSWDFGDGNTSAIENPTHIYAAEGIYKVVLIAVSNDGCTNSTTQNVNVRSVATGIENNSNSQEVIVNNIGNNVVVSFKGYTNENASIIISNVLGQVLFTGNHNVSSTFNYTLQDVDTQVLIIKTTIDGKSIKNLLALTSK
jgi:PKD repeat protein